MAGFGASEGFGQASTVMDASSSVCASGSWVQAYANYLKQYAGDYAAAGDPLTYSGPENEANLSTSYDSMQLTPAQTAPPLSAESLVFMNAGALHASANTFVTS